MDLAEETLPDEKTLQAEKDKAQVGNYFKEKKVQFDAWLVWLKTDMLYRIK